MPRYRVADHTGPTQVQHFANIAREAGFKDVVEGTETVYATVTAPDPDKALLDYRDGVNKASGYQVSGLRPRVILEVSSEDY